jgi:hypothetical protein
MIRAGISPRTDWRLIRPTRKSVWQFRKSQANAFLFLQSVDLSENSFLTLSNQKSISRTPSFYLEKETPVKRVVFLEPRKIQIEEGSKPKRKADEALLRVRFVGICGTDLHTYQGTNPLVAYPVVPGHELCGEVGEPDVKFSPGDLVVVEPLLSGGQCYPCRIGAAAFLKRRGNERSR